jgi:hypothetical protein
MYIYVYTYIIYIYECIHIFVGQSTLMIVVAIQNYAVFAALMNTRRPTVDVNLVKSVGMNMYTYMYIYICLYISVCI